MIKRKEPFPKKLKAHLTRTSCFEKKGGRGKISVLKGSERAQTDTDEGRAKRAEFRIQWSIRGEKKKRNNQKIVK